MDPILRNIYQRYSKVNCIKAMYFEECMVGLLYLQTIDLVSRKFIFGAVEEGPKISRRVFFVGVVDILS